jgi:DNA-binding NtrC family response regulator
MNQRILILDDDVSICKIYTLMLSRLSIDVDSEVSGEAIITRYVAAQSAGTPYLGVILDLTVQTGMGGLATLKQLKAIDPHVYTIVSSGAARETIESQYEEQGFSAVLPKPFRFQDVADCVARIKAATKS